VQHDKGKSLHQETNDELEDQNELPTEDLKDTIAANHDSQITQNKDDIYRDALQTIISVRYFTTSKHH
jgi:hypothetical protein